MAKIKKDAAKSAAAESNKGSKGMPKQPKKAEKVSGEKREAKAKLFRERITHSAKMVKAQKYTDDMIVAEVNEKFPDYPGKKFDKKECDRTRWMMKNNLIKDLDTVDWPYERCVDVDGKIYPRTQKPKPPKKSRAKVTKENDPLANVAGVDVHSDDEGEAAPKKKQKEKI
jgi:hypothetical protein